jgi:antitoxin component of MazEF toxin-antitoxin module
MKQNVQDIIIKFVADNVQFTKFDITKVIRRTVDPNAKHYEVREIAGDYMTSAYLTGAAYTKSLTAIDNIAGWAFVYHNENEAENYSVEQMDEYIDSLVGTSVAISQTPVQSPSVSAKDIIIHLTNEKRVNIPKTMLQSVGISYDHCVDININEDNTIEIGLDVPAGIDTLEHKNLCTGKHNRLRLSYRDLKMINVNNEVSVHDHGDKIVIAPC